MQHQNVVQVVPGLFRVVWWVGARIGQGEVRRAREHRGGRSPRAERAFQAYCPR